MLQVDNEKLFARLSRLSRQALANATGLCVVRTNFNVELEHWLIALADAQDTDWMRILEAYDVKFDRMKTDLVKALDRLKTGNTNSPRLSPDIIDLATEAWSVASINYGAAQIRSGHLMLTMLSNRGLKQSAMSICTEFDKINVDALAKTVVEVCADSAEDRDSTNLIGSSSAAARPAAGGARAQSTPALDQFTIDLTARARSGKIDAVIGRDLEIRQVIDILTRRRQNNPILTGEAGVGKTAVAEGFALRIAVGDVPAALKDVELRTLDLGLLQAGAGVKGEFENRLKSVIDEVKSSPKPIILFIDEAHTLIGAGGSAGQGDAANLLKPALARGELRTLAATTWAEYKKYFEKDAALARRFQVVKVEEPSEAVAIEMVRGLTKTLEEHHKVIIYDEAIIDAVKLSSRYISGRQLPDKAISLMDTSCARINLSQSSIPPALEAAQRQQSQLKLTREILTRETVTGLDHAAQLEALDQQLVGVERELEQLSERWMKEKELVEQIRQLTDKLYMSAQPATGTTNGQPPSAPGAKPAETVAAGAATTTTGSAAPTGTAKPTATSGAPATPTATGSTATGTATAEATEPPPTPEMIAQWKSQLGEHRVSLRALQGDAPLVHPFVDRQAIAETVAAWTGIPVGRMVANEINTVLELHQLMERYIVGQSHALKRIAQSIRTSRAQLNDPRAPIGVFLLAGTSGVGKTETAITLAQLLYGGEQNMTVINMSEFKEEHKVSLLMGSPPGYVGYGEGGVLTEAVRRKPYSVILLDEMEKAHPGVQDIFYQVFDKGTMKDGEGRDIDFKNTVILMTTNAGTDLIKSLCSDPDTTPEPEAFVEALFPELLKTFKPAFLGRLTTIPYYPLAEDVIRKIIWLKLGKVGQRLREHYNATFAFSEELVQAIADRCKEVDTGARNIDHILTRSLLPELSTQLLGRLAEGKGVSSVDVTVSPDQNFAFQIS